MNINKEIRPDMGAVAEKRRSGFYYLPVDNPKSGIFVMKKCRTCGKEKPLTEYYTRNKSPFYFIDCKKCHCRKTGARIKMNGTPKTQKWVLNEMYFGMIKHSRNRDYNPPNFTNKEFKKWCYDNTDFVIIYENWVKSKHDKWAKPSVDRIDNYKSYTFDNIRIVTWRVNFECATLDILTGRNTKQCKTVYQYDVDGNFIREYFSVRYAGRCNNIPSVTISTVARKNAIFKGYIWSYEKKN